VQALAAAAEHGRDSADFEEEQLLCAEYSTIYRLPLGIDLNCLAHCVVGWTEHEGLGLKVSAAAASAAAG
jgi:hypothetical protein